MMTEKLMIQFGARNLKTSEGANNLKIMFSDEEPYYNYSMYNLICCSC